MKLRVLSLLAVFLLAVSAGAAEGARKKKKVKKDEYENNKYKSYRVLTPEEPRTYRFDAKGNPIPVDKPKKKRKKKRLSSEDEAAASCEESPESEACSQKPADGEPQP